MFTGLVEDMGSVRGVERRTDAVVFDIAPHALPLAELAVGDSVSHDGVCLTITAVTVDVYTVLAGAETLACTNLGELVVGAKVNLERAMRLGDRLGGHMVAGHVDGVGTLVARQDNGANLVLTFRASTELLRYVIEKGSITVDGVSLTVNQVDRVGGEQFMVALIPHTRDHTTLGTRSVGQHVNLEVDLVAKYVERLAQNYATAPATSLVPSSLVPSSSVQGTSS